MLKNEIIKLISEEEKRQHRSISLIASENICSEDVRRAQGSVLTDKYAEGYPGKRYYAGCSVVDKIEDLTISAACSLFSSNFANVQPHSGSQANQAIFLGFLNPGDRVLGMQLNHGGHLTHGFKSSVTGKLYDCYFYGVNGDGVLDMENVRDIALRVRPKLIIAGASCYSRVIDWQKFADIRDEVKQLREDGRCYLLADMAHFSGLIAGGAYPSPVSCADFCTSTTHKGLRGPRGGFILWNNSEYTKIINSSVFPGVQGGPMMHTIAAKGIAFSEAMQDEFPMYCRKVIENARIMSEALKNLGWNIISGGTDCHMFLVDLGDISGQTAQDALEGVGIYVSKSTLPHDKAGSNSGIRIGTASMTSQNLHHALDIANKINTCLKRLRTEKNF